MQPFRYHVFVCEQQKPEGVPCCSARGSAKVIDALRAEVARQGLTGSVQITTCGSIGLCERGPNMVVYPDGIWYSCLSPADIPELVREHFANGRPLERLLNRDEEALRQEITANRDRYLQGMRMMAEAGVVPEPVMNIVRGYQPSRVILSAIELDVFTAIGDGATAEEVAQRIGGALRATDMLLNALVSLELLDKREGRFYNGPVAARHFTAKSPHDARASLMHSVNGWRRWSTLTEAVKAGGAIDRTEPPDRGEEWLRAFIAAMEEGSKLRAPALVRAVGPEGVRRMLDIGGGSGAYSIAFARTAPALRADILDVPAVAPIAREYVDKAGMSDAIKVVEGDLRQPNYGGPYDLVLISSIAHMLSPEDNVAMLRKAYEALAPGGRVVISDFILNPDRTGPKFAALFALNMLVATQSGNSYTEAEYTEWLTEAGFREIRRVAMPGPSNLIIGVRS